MYKSVYNFNIPHLDTPSVSSFSIIPSLTGTVDLNLQITKTDSTGDFVKKLVIEFSDEPNQQYTLQSSLTSNTLLEKSISHVFSTTEQNPTSYTISITAIRSTYVFDYHTLVLDLYQTTLQGLSGLSLLKSTIFDTEKTTNNLLIIAETNNPQQTVNFVIPGNLNS